MGKKLTKNIPILRFPEFVEVLKLTYLGEILDFKNGINADKSQYGKGYKFINVLDIINESPIYYETILGSVEITEQEFIKNDVQYGDVLFQRSSEIREETGQSNIYLDRNQDATFGGFIIRGRPKVKFDPIYFNYLLKTQAVRKEITDRSGGSTRFNVGQNSLSEVPIFITNSLAEQEKIASFLGAIDRRLTQLRRKRELLQTYKRGVMQKIFSQEIRFKSAIGSHFPGWEKKKLEDISNRIGDGIHSTPRYDENGEYYFINGNNLINNRIKFFENTKRVNQAEYLKYKNNLTSQTILISINGTIGNLAFYNNEKIVLGKSACYIDLKSEQNKFFIFYLLQTSAIKSHFSQEVTGSTIKNLSLATIKNTKAFFPNNREQEKIVTFLTAIDRKIEAISCQIDQTEQFKKGLLQKLFV